MSLVSNIASLPTPPDPAEQGMAKLRETADHIVGSVFYGTLLRIQRESQLKGPYGHGGRGEEIFQAQLDQHLAEEAGRSGRCGLREAIVSQFENRVRSIAKARMAEAEA